jgi:hypothetical protein
VEPEEEACREGDEGAGCVGMKRRCDDMAPRSPLRPSEWSEGVRREQ